MSFGLHTLTCQIIVQQILLIFGEKNTYTTLVGPTSLLISDIFLQNLIFTYINEKKSFLHCLIKSYRFINFSPTQLNGPTNHDYFVILSLGVTHRPQVVIQVAAIIINLQQPHILWRMLNEPHQRCLPVQMSLPIQTV